MLKGDTAVEARAAALFARVKDAFPSAKTCPTIAEKWILLFAWEQGLLILDSISTFSSLRSRNNLEKNQLKGGFFMLSNERHYIIEI